MSTRAPRGYARSRPRRWKAFFMTFFAWVLDSFDFTILTFVLAGHPR